MDDGFVEDASFSGLEMRRRLTRLEKLNGEPENYTATKKGSIQGKFGKYSIG
jgi:hypothetical protein